MGAQGHKVASYFDAISDNYTSRYSERNPFHNYFFRQRLLAATDGLQLAGKTVLDIGAGTGALYDELIQRDLQTDYFACDISSRMLEESFIPKDRTFVGSPTTLDFPREHFDFIFSLGVTTYQAPDELANNWRFISRRLARDGIAVVSFTNLGSIDYTVRQLSKFVRPLVRKRVLGQDFSTFAYRASEVDAMARSAGLRIAKLRYLNQTFSPFNTLLPRPSVSLAKIIERAPREILPMLSGDFVVFAERSEPS